jgi:hypothetical protein
VNAVVKGDVQIVRVLDDPNGNGSWQMSVWIRLDFDAIDPGDLFAVAIAWEMQFPDWTPSHVE